MSRLAVQLLIFVAVLVAAVGWLSHCTPGTARADEKSPNTASLKVIYAKSYSDYVLVELYQDGKLLRTRELKNGFAIGKWSKNLRFMHCWGKGAER